MNGKNHRAPRFLPTGRHFPSAGRRVGGYLVAASASVSLTMWLPMARGEAVVTGMMTSFLVYLVAVLWCFACRSAWQAWFGLIAPSVVLAAVSGLAY